MNRLHLALIGILLSFIGLWGGFYFAHILYGWLCFAAVISGMAFIIIGLSLTITSLIADQESWVEFKAFLTGEEPK